MAVIDKRRGEAPDSLMSDETFGLVNQFYDGIDDVVRDLVMQVARKRMLKAGEDVSTIMISDADVRQAAQLMMEQLQSMPFSVTTPDKLKNLL